MTVPQTITGINACNAVIEVDDENGTPTDISGSSNTASLGFSKQMGSAYTFSGDYPIRIECKKDATLDISAIYTRVNTEARYLFDRWFELGGRRTISIYPAGQDTGERYYTGEWRLESFDIPIDASDANPIVISISCVADGAITPAAYSS